MSLKQLDILVLQQIMEASSLAGGGGIHGANSVKDDEEKKTEESSEEEREVEQKLREYIRNKIQKTISEHNRIKLQEEKALRGIIRSLIKESDVSDMHPHRSTGINVLEDLLKKMVPTLRSDYKRLTSDISQRKSFRAHIIKAIMDSLAPMQVNDQYGSSKSIYDKKTKSSYLMSAPPEEEEASAIAEELALLDEVGVEVTDDDTQPGDEEKKIPIEDDDTPSEEESFGSGLEDFDETGRNMAFAGYKKIQQYILDAYDSLANPKDKKIFTDYLITNSKLYFDKFEDELLKTVEEPTTDEYEKVKSNSL